MKKGFTFNGLKSSDFGVYITGEAVYDAPVYDYDFAEVPGRSGDLILDNGRWNNIEVRYPAAVRDLTKMQAIRDWLNGPRGYCEPTDDYNPDQYRLAVFSGGLSVSPFNNRAGRFDLVFNCKPQRFYKPGVSSRFAPLFQDGLSYYTSDLLAMDTTFENETCVLIQENTTASAAFENLAHINVWRAYGSGSSTTYTGTQARALVQMSGTTATIDLFDLTGHGNAYTYYQLVFTNTNINYHFKASNGADVRIRSAITLYNPTPYASKPLLLFYSSQSSGTDGAVPAIVVNGIEVDADGFNGTLYVDCDLQDAYLITDGQKVNGNSYVTLTDDGEITTEFPVLKSGSNTISMIPDVTITSDIRLGECWVEIDPRWFTI